MATEYIEKLVAELARRRGVSTDDVWAEYRPKSQQYLSSTWFEEKLEEHPVFINATPHEVVLNDGTTYPPSGLIVRVAQTWYLPVNGVGRCINGKAVGLPSDKMPGQFYIVSAMVLSAERTQANGRRDLVAPATGHPDCQRNAQGQILSVPFLYR